MGLEFETVLKQSDESLTNKVISFGRKIVPQRYRAIVKDFLFGAPKIPFERPYRFVGGVEALFYIKNTSDFDRIVSARVEAEYRSRMEEVFIKEKGRTFLDIGCAQGLYSVLAAKHGLFVDAFDPDPISIVSLGANIKLNQVGERIKINPVALSDCEGKTPFFIDRGGSFAPSMIQTVGGLQEKIEVNTTTVDNLIRRKNLPSPAVIKIDVEGAEGRVINGMKNLLSSSDKPKNMFVELHQDYLPIFNEDMNSVYETVVGFGYRVAWSARCPSGLLCHFVAN